jgi:hypothetical protein
VVHVVLQIDAFLSLPGQQNPGGESVTAIRQQKNARLTGVCSQFGGEFTAQGRDNTVIDRIGLGTAGNAR